MNKELRILSSFIVDRSSFDAVRHVLEEDDFTDISKILARHITEYYDRDPDAHAVSVDWLKDTILSTLPNPKHHEPVLHVLDNQLGDVSVPNALEEYKQLKKLSIGERLAETLLAHKDPTELMEQFTDLHHADVRRDDKVYIGTSLDELLEVEKPENLIKVRPLSLNERLDGGVPPGTQIAVYAPTEVGKSMFTINMSCGFMHDGRKVLYCGNEDPVEQMLLRFYSRMSGATKKEMLTDSKKYVKIAHDNGFGNLIFKPMSPGSPYEIRKLIEEYQPEIVVVDQMANMNTGSKSFSKTEKNEFLAAKLREIAQAYGVVNVIVHQASDDAYGKVYLDKNHMYYSNVGVQGQMDVMIGLGMDDAMESENIRMCCLTKNKRNGNHDCFPVKVQPLLSKVGDVK